MKLTINTTLFQELVSKALKGASFNKLLPLTSLLCMSCEGGKFELRTTDGSNYLYVTHDFQGENFSAVVPADVFGKLISKLTCDNTVLEKENGVLTVIGNGKYSIELPLDENGSEINYPNPLVGMDYKSSAQAVKTTDIAQILTVAKPALAVTMENPCYTGYYCDSKRVISTDSFMICGLNNTLFSSPKLISSVLMDLLDIITGDAIKIHVSETSDDLVFFSDDVMVYGHTMEGIEDFAVDAITELLDTPLPCKCSVSRSKLLEVLDRLVLFVDTYDNNGIYLTFGNSGLQISSKKSSGVETVEYIKKDETEDFTCCINVVMLQSQVKAYDGDSIDIEYGSGQAIKLISTNSVQLIALLEDN